MVVVPVSCLAGVCSLITMCCVRKEMLFHSGITVGSRNRLKAAVEEKMTLRMAVIFERPRTAHFSVLFLLHEFTQQVIGAHRK